MAANPNVHTIPSNRPIPGEPDTVDRVNARLAQANAITQLLRADLGEVEGGRMASHLVAEALWAVNDLLDDAHRAINGEHIGLSHELTPQPAGEAGE